jgi:phosphoglycolate phosphatase
MEPWRKLRPFPNATPRLAFLDFDGTLSLLRAGWMPIMRRQMFEALRPLGSDESDASIMFQIESWIQENNGKPTWRQMERLEAEVTRRGGEAIGWPKYLADFSSRLMGQVVPRKQALRDGTELPVNHCVEGAHSLLDNLQRHGLELHLVSGTERQHVVEEAELLGLAKYFGPRIHGPMSHDDGFSKQKVLETLVPDVTQRNMVLAIGDGPVEISLVSGCGGLAVGVARSENGLGMDPATAQLLDDCGAHALVANFQLAEAFTDWLVVHRGEKL